MAETLAVYTVVMGADYPLPDPVPCPGVAYICFTNMPDLAPNGWTIRVVDPLFPLDLVRSSREQKIRPHRWLAEFDRSLYIDTTVQLTGSPVALWDYLVPDEGVVFGAMPHSFRATVEDEFGVVKGKGFDDRAVLARQLDTYRKTAPDILQRRPIWGGMLARRHADPALQEAMELWFAHVLRYGRRDQLSLVLAVSQLPPAAVSLISCNNHRSDFHRWPVGAPDKPPRFFEELKHPKAGIGVGVMRTLSSLKQSLIRV